MIYLKVRKVLAQTQKRTTRGYLRVSTAQDESALDLQCSGSVITKLPNSPLCGPCVPCPQLHIPETLS